ncbi:hypothetical protein D3C76_879840 [compost metagenome]
MLVEGGKCCFCQLSVTVDRLGIGTVVEQFEVHSLAQQRPHARTVKHQPGDGRPVGTGFTGKQLSVLLRQIQQDGRGFEQSDTGAAVDQHGNASVGVEPEKVRKAVFAQLDTDVLEGVCQAHFFQGNGDLEAIG